MAGRSLRFARSPVAPKMTSVVGWTGSLSSPATSGFAFRCSIVAIGPPPLGRLLALDRVAAELVPERGVHLRRVRLVLPRREPREQRGGDDRRRHGLVDRVEDRPAPLARVRDPAADIGQVVALLLERERRQVEQPRAHYRALTPEV